MLSTEEVLENVVRLVSLLDDVPLHEGDGLPILELANGNDNPAGRTKNRRVEVVIQN